MCIPDGFSVYGRKCHYCIQVLVGEVLVGNGPELVHSAEIEIFSFCALQNSLALSRIEEFALLVEKFQCVPLSRVVRCRKDKSTIRARQNDGHFGGRRRCETCTDNVYTARYKCAAYYIFHHFA